MGKGHINGEPEMAGQRSQPSLGPFRDGPVVNLDVPSIQA